MKLFLRNLLLFFLSSLATLALFETGFQIANFPKTEGLTEIWMVPHRLYHHFHKPNISFFNEVDEEKVTRKQKVVFNADGLRDRPTTEGLPKILFIGDSFVQGSQVDVDELFGNKVEDKLKNIDVINVGCSSWSSILYYNWLKENLSKVKDLKSVYLFFFSNDPNDTLKYWKKADEPKDLEHITFTGYVDKNDLDDTSFRFWLYKHSKIYFLIYRAKERIKERINKFRNVNSVNESDTFLNFFRGFATLEQKEAVALDNAYLVKISQLLARNQIKFSVVYIPIAQQIGLDENEIGSQYYGEELKEVISRSTIFQDNLKTLASENSFDFIDLTPSLRNYKKEHPQPHLYNNRDAHFNAVGHQAVAEVMANYIK